MSKNKKICTKCGYLRKANDDIFVPADECPKCRVIYHKFEYGMISFDMVFNQKRMNRSKKRKGTNFSYVLVFFLVFVSIFLVGFITGRTYTKLEKTNLKNNIQAMYDE